MLWLGLSAITGLITDTILQKYFAMGKRPWTLLLSLLSCGILLTAFDNSILIVKGCIFSQLLILVGFIDYKIREIPNAILVPITMCGFIDLRLLSSLEGAAISFVIMMAAYLLTESIGGGDIKLMTACAFVLGFYSSIGAGIISFSAPILIAKIMKRKGYYPLGPYIGIGCFIAYLLT